MYNIHFVQLREKFANFNKEAMPIVDYGFNIGQAKNMFGNDAANSMFDFGKIKNYTGKLNDQTGEVRARTPGGNILSANLKKKTNDPFAADLGAMPDPKPISKKQTQTTTIPQTPASI